MATLTAWRFPDPETAAEVETALLFMQQKGILKVIDAVVVSWPADLKQPKVQPLHKLSGPLAVSGTFWGLLLGLVFAVPLLGGAVGATAGALAGSLVSFGIDKEFVESMRKEIVPGTSALLLYTVDTDLDQVREAFPDDVRLVNSNISEADEAKLRELFER